MSAGSEIKTSYREGLAHGSPVMPNNREKFAEGTPPPSSQMVAGKFALGDRVCKTKGSSWHGRVVGFYSTELTPIGYAIESEREPGSVQIYPEAALSTATEGSGE